MAEINNGIEGRAKVSVQIDVLGKVPGQGFISDGPVAMNSEMGVMDIQVSLVLGEEELLGRRMQVFAFSLTGWAEAVESMVNGEPGDFEGVEFGFESPHLILNVRRFDWVTEVEPDSGLEPEAITRYEFLAGIDAGYLSGEEEIGITGDGPGIYMSPASETLLQFAHDLRSEVEMALLLDR